MRTKPSAIRLSLVLVLFTGLCVYRLCPTSPPKNIYWVSGDTMGTTYNVKIANQALSSTEERSLKTLVQEELDQVEALMSTYRPDSEVSRFNAWREEAPFPISEDVYKVLVHAQAISDESKGAFDITVGPAVRRWGFGPDPRIGPPNPQEIHTLRSQIGYTRLKLSPKRLLVKKHQSLEIDLSAIAKGYAVDQVSLQLEKKGYLHHMVEVGGEMRLRGKKAAKSPWRIGIENPNPETNQVLKPLVLTDISVATSGSYRNSYVVGDRSYSHTIDPRTAMPITHRLISATVFHPNCAAADAYATALMVMGESQGLEFAIKYNLAIHLIIEQPKGRRKVVESPAFKMLLKSQKGQQ
jgi:FAD:protein FMN transferase